jgi:alkaline phosphatase
VTNEGEPTPGNIVGADEVTPALARNVIFMIPDGFGDTAAIAYRHFKGTVETPAWENGLQASVQTDSASSPVTDSAASATAYATGLKTYNGGVGVDMDRNPLVSVLDLASEAGKATGIVTSDAVTGATPAAFAASNVDRGNQDQIAQEYIDNGYLDVILGGGRESFVVDPDRDGATTLDEAKAAGFEYVSTLDELTAFDGDRLLGLFGFGPLGLPVGEEEPTLAEMTETALARLSQDDDGFFLVVEEAGTDIWGHANDAAAVMRSAAAYEGAVGLALQYAEANPDTLVISVADHETGGMTLELGAERTPASFRSYQTTYAEMLVAVRDEITDLGLGADIDEIIATFQATISELTGGVVSLTADEISSILDASTAEDAYLAFSALLNSHGGVDFSTTGHTGVNVSLHAFGAGAELREGAIDNISVAGWLAEAMGLLLPGDQQGGGGSLISGTAVGDRLVGDAGSDVIAGALGNDSLIGGVGSDRLIGDGEDDRLAGRRGADVLDGGEGDDRLKGGIGDDVLEGGGGSDVFIFRENTGSDWIADLAVGEDVIQFKTGLLSDFDALLAACQEVDDHVLISLAVGTEIRIEGVNMDLIKQEAFLFG